MYVSVCGALWLVVSIQCERKCCCVDMKLMIKVDDAQWHCGVFLLHVPGLQCWSENATRGRNDPLQ